MLIHDLLATISGTLVGFVLGLIGGGGSILAVPLLVYLVGVKSPHVAIGTSAVAVALSALVNLWGHARQNHVKWRCALVFAAAGTVGAVLGSSFGKQLDGQKLLVLFGVLMMVIAAAMFFKKAVAGDEAVRLDWSSASPNWRPCSCSMAWVSVPYPVFSEIGGGFLIVPGLMAATSMPLLFAIGSSLVSVAAFGLTTAGNYALSGLIDWRLVAFFIIGGIAGGVLGRRAAGVLSERKQTLAHVFAGIVAAVGIYVVLMGVNNLTGFGRSKTEEIEPVSVKARGTSLIVLDFPTIPILNLRSETWLEKSTRQRVQLRTRLAKPPAIKRCKRKARPISSKEKQRKLQRTQRALSKACRIASRSSTSTRRLPNPRQARGHPGRNTARPFSTVPRIVRSAP